MGSARGCLDSSLRPRTFKAGSTEHRSQESKFLLYDKRGPATRLRTGGVTKKKYAFMCPIVEPVFPRNSGAREKTLVFISKGKRP
ncbi:hypothetical protein TNIN_25511 [Trichonephila inaurata madagascariensis]|uniref:Uncharacterized protein n=1 Tax=Trichonephila inaurata madagascariensis TaxID=2747483 RepID=A0A8X6Y7E1_9ARAC|nr:hypothetical protein TNIN_25511 [Trichonephila inaurata madagascariensis]